MTVNTRVVKLLLRRQEASYIPLADDLKLQIIPSLSYLPLCQKHHFAAFIQDIAIVLVWDDDPRNILDRTRNLEEQLMTVIWKGASSIYDDGVSNQEEDSQAPTVANEEGDGVCSESLAEKPRKIVMIQSWLSAVTLAMVIAALGFGLRAVAIEVKVDKSYLRVAFAVVVPIQIWLALVGSDFL
jgi:hypothetical protein